MPLYSVGSDRYISLRMLTKTPIKQLNKHKLELNEEKTKDILKDYKNKTKDIFHILDLCTNNDMIPSRTHFCDGFLAVFFINVLLKTNYFNKDKLDEEKILIGSLLIRLFEIRVHNVHSVETLKPKRSRKLKDCVPTTLGGAMYPTVALFNHSCMFKIHSFYNGGKTTKVAIQQIKKGSQVDDIYYPSFSKAEKQERQDYLYENYRFRCECEVSRPIILF